MLGDRSPASSNGISKHSGEEMLFESITRSSVLSRRTLNCPSPIHLFEAKCTRDREISDNIPHNKEEGDQGFFRRSLHARRGLQQDLGLSIPLTKSSSTIKNMEEHPSMPLSVGRQTSFQQDSKKSTFYQFCIERPPSSPSWVCSETCLPKPRVLSCVEPWDSVHLFASEETEAPSQ